MNVSGFVNDDGYGNNSSLSKNYCPMNTMKITFLIVDEIRFHHKDLTIRNINPLQILPLQVGYEG